MKLKAMQNRSATTTTSAAGQNMRAIPISSESCFTLLFLQSSSSSSAFCSEQPISAVSKITPVYSHYQHHVLTTCPRLFYSKSTRPNMSLCAPESKSTSVDDFDTESDVCDESYKGDLSLLNVNEFGQSQTDGDGDGDFCIAIEKLEKNTRRIQSKISIKATLDVVWNILTDYERLADFIPGLSVSQLLDKRDNFARLFQIGQQNLAFGIKFNAKGVVDCYEKEMESLTSGKKRDIEFEMIEGDFHLFKGRWSMLQESDSTQTQENCTTLSYIVDLKPKLWLPVRLIEGRLCMEIEMNLASIRDEAQRRVRLSTVSIDLP